MPSDNFEHAAIEPNRVFGVAAKGPNPGNNTDQLEQFLADIANSRDSLTIGLE